MTNIRNIGIIAHIDAGKTTVSERFLYLSGKSYKIGNIDEGNTIMDYLDEERKRGITIVAAAASFNWKKDNEDALIHLIDTPGHIDFTAEVERSIRVCDGAVVIFSGVEGVEAQSEKVWHQSDKYNLAKIAFINKLDRLGANFSRVVDEIKSKFSTHTIIPFHLPIGIESDFSGIVDLVNMNEIKFSGENGENVTHNDIPDNLKDIANSARDELIAELAEMSEDIAELYLNEKEIPIELLKSVVKENVINGTLCPIFAGSAKMNVGVQPLLNAIVDYLPTPNECKNFSAINPKTHKIENLDISNPNFYGLVFKIVASGSADLLYLRTYSGKLSVNDTLLNPRTNEKVRVKRILRLYSKNVEAIDDASLGDIVGIIGPHNIVTGDTLCAINKPMILEKIEFPEPVISFAIEPKSIKDKDKLESSLKLLCREDPTLHIKEDPNTGQRILSGMGELHLEINAERLLSEFNVEAKFGSPQVAFREIIKEESTITGIFDTTIGDKELFAEVDIQFIPIHKLKTGLEVLSEVKNKDVSKTWLNSALNTLNNALKTGGNLGYPLIYIRAILKDIRISSHKTTEGAIGGAIMDAVNKVVLKGTVLMEPLMNLNINAPEEVIGEITGYIQPKRAIIHKIETVQGSKHLVCEVPMAEMFGFSKALPKLSGGRASFSMEPCGYQELIK